jgi:hypothetical protein
VRYAVPLGICPSTYYFTNALPNWVVPAYGRDKSAVYLLGAAAEVVQCVYLHVAATDIVQCVQSPGAVFKTAVY